MKKLIAICLLIPALAYSFTYKNNPQTGKPDLVTTSVADLTDISTGYVPTATFTNYTSNDRLTVSAFANYTTVDRTYSLPTATSSVLGGVKPDGTSILNTAGAISATAASVGAIAIGGNAGTVTTNANLTGPITSTGNATAVASQTGTGSTFVMSNQPGIVMDGWTAPTLLNSWVDVGGAYEVAGYSKDSFGNVHIRGAVSTGTTGVSAFVLPSGYRPESDLIYPVVTSGGTLGYIKIFTNGDVCINGASASAFTSLRGYFKP